MAKKKSNSKKSTMLKIAEKVGELAGKMVNEKEHLVEMASGAIKSVKEKIQNIGTGKNDAPKKKAKAVVKKAANKIVKPIAKKVTKTLPVKKAAVVKKAAKKIVKAVAPAKKAAVVKKAVKKVVKKSAVVKKAVKKTATRKK